MSSASTQPTGGLSVPLAPTVLPPARPCFVPGALPQAVASAIWRGDQLGSPVEAVLSSGFAALDAQLPGGGWPCHALSEILSPQSGLLEWRLLGPLLRQVCAAGRSVVLVGPPKPPHLPGLRWDGLLAGQLIWVQAETPAERLWSAEQLIRGNACGALIAWLPQVRADQIRRLQVLAAANEGPVFVCRPSAAARESSAAPLRVHASVGPDWTLHIDILKRKGPPLEQTLRLLAVPGGLAPILTPRLRQPSRLLPRNEHHDVVVGPADSRQQRHPVLP